jgi:hypothetical protein
VSGLFLTKTRRLFLEDVQDGHVRREYRQSSLTDFNTEDQHVVTAKANEAFGAGWIVLDPRYAVLQAAPPILARVWTVTDLGRAVLRDAADGRQ